MPNFDLRLARLIYQSSLSPDRKDYYVGELVQGRDFQPELALEIARENERLLTRVAELKRLSSYNAGHQFTTNLDLDELAGE